MSPPNSTRSEDRYFLSTGYGDRQPQKKLPVRRAKSGEDVILTHGNR
jgi:hypothetical protein